MNPPCIFCPNPRTNKLGEHVFDDWLNRLNGRVIEDRYTFLQLGEDGEVVRTFKKRKIDTASAVICDPCNNEWMSDLTNEMKSVAEGFIRYERSATLLPLGIATLATFIFMKSAVLDAAYNTGMYSRPMCLRFAETRRMPAGLQIWLSWFRDRHRFSSRVLSNTLTPTSGAFLGFQFYVFTYMVGHLVFQLTYPRWTKKSIIDRPATPFITQAVAWDVVSIPIWPNVATAEWPPAKYLDSDGLEEFNVRFRNMRSTVRPGRTR